MGFEGLTITGAAGWSEDSLTLTPVVGTAGLMVCSQLTSISSI